ncbi:MAG TPA: GNAT family N-acetyltransferase [Acidimicrobiales bacterium]|nr:GNAT family N-acetyltransferase [Acidimicrobiales bacterium]
MSVPAGPAPPPAAYPRELEAEVLLTDGRVAALRPIVPSDAPALLRLAGQLSDEAVYFRFFSPRRELSEAELAHLATVDYRDRLALVALVEGELVAVARYERLGESEDAEVAFTVRDDQQRRGLGTVLLEHLASAALARSVRTFVADTLAENSRMLGVFRSAGFVESARYDAGVIRVTLQLEPVPAYLEKVDERDRAAAVRSISSLLEPATVAIVGASTRPGTIGHELVRNVLSGGFTGSLYPVNPNAAEVLGVPAYPSVSALPGPVDLAVIAVPAGAVAGVVEECGRVGCRGLVVVSAGFAEMGPEGAAAERELVSVARRAGMRLVGPNCMGLINTAPHVRLNATFAPVAPVPGRIAFSSQSGGLGVAILDEATRRGLGISSFVSVGNKADVSGNDLIRYFDADPGTDLILLYLESFGNPRHFSRIARRVARHKPIVAVKSGRSRSGSRGASSHTAASSSPDPVVDALFRQAGVIRVETLEELFDVAELLSHQPLPAGGRVAVLGNAGGPGVLAADACEGLGLEVPLLSEATQQRLREVLSPEAGVRNPVDCVASATAQEYRRALEILLRDDGIDAVIVIFTPPLVTEGEDVAAAVAEVAAASAKPVVANFLAAGRAVEALRAGERRVPWFAYPESAARALSLVVPYARWRATPEPGRTELEGTDPVRARRLLGEALEEAAERPIDGEGQWLPSARVREVLAAYSIELEDGRAVCDREGPPPAETIVGLADDPSFGPLVTFSIAGIPSDVLDDRALSLVPVSFEEARSLVTSLRSSRLLEGYRGSPPADLDALADLVCRVGAMAEDLPELLELELCPVVSTGRGCHVLGARMRVVAVRPEPELRRRRLR